MNRVIILDSVTVQTELLKKQIEKELGYPVSFVDSVNEAKTYGDAGVVIFSIQKSVDNYSPVAGVPSIVVTGGVQLQSREFLMASHILDAIADYSLQNRRYILELISRIDLLSKITVVICEKDPVILSMIKRNVATLGVKTKGVKNAKEMLSLLHSDDSVRLVMVSAHLGAASGLSVVEEIRKTYNKNDLPVIALLEEQDSEEVEVSFYRTGATDSIVKQFSTPNCAEIFRSRVMLTIGQVVTNVELNYLVERDFMTDCYNRRYFFDAGLTVFANYLRGNICCAVAMLDIDDFKQINDRFGHSTGDRAIIAFAEILHSGVRQTDLVARFGGEEFCILFSGSDVNGIMTVLERIRVEVESLTHYGDNGEPFSFTISTGVTNQQAETLEEMVSRADAILYVAKEQGKNRVVDDTGLNGAKQSNLSPP